MPRIEYGPPAQGGVRSLQYLSGADGVPEGASVSQRTLWLGVGLGGLALAFLGSKATRPVGLAAAAVALLKV